MNISILINSIIVIKRKSKLNGSELTLKINFLNAPKKLRINLISSQFSYRNRNKHYYKLYKTTDILLR